MIKDTAFEGPLISMSDVDPGEYCIPFLLSLLSQVMFMVCCVDEVAFALSILWDLLIFIVMLLLLSLFVEQLPTSRVHRAGGYEYLAIWLAVFASVFFIGFIAYSNYPTEPTMLSSKDDISLPVPTFFMVLSILYAIMSFSFAIATAVLVRETLTLRKRRVQMLEEGKAIYDQLKALNTRIPNLTGLMYIVQPNGEIVGCKAEDNELRLFDINECMSDSSLPYILRSGPICDSDGNELKVGEQVRSTVTTRTVKSIHEAGDKNPLGQIVNHPFVVYEDNSWDYADSVVQA